MKLHILLDIVSFDSSAFRADLNIERIFLLISVNNRRTFLLLLMSFAVLSINVSHLKNSPIAVKWSAIVKRSLWPADMFSKNPAPAVYCSNQSQGKRRNSLINYMRNYNRSCLHFYTPHMYMYMTSTHKFNCALLLLIVER